MEVAGRDEEKMCDITRTLPSVRVGQDFTIHCHLILSFLMIMMKCISLIDSLILTGIVRSILSIFEVTIRMKGKSI
jgi:hypothetical protein